MKRALVIGVQSYSVDPLRAPVNDANDVRDFLVGRCGFSAGAADLVPESQARKAELAQKLTAFAASLRAGDTALFYFSGHGARVPAPTSSGTSGVAEALCPIDYQQTTLTAWLDKELVTTLRTIPSGVTLTWIADACHSGGLSTVLSRLKKWFERGTTKSLGDAPGIASVREARPASHDDTFVRLAAQVDGLFLAACEHTEKAKEIEFGARWNSVFTRVLLDKLAESGGLTTPVSTVVGRVADRIRDIGFSQTPQIVGSAAARARPFLG